MAFNFFYIYLGIAQPLLYIAIVVAWTTHSHGLHSVTLAAVLLLVVVASSSARHLLTEKVTIIIILIIK